jgi:hypothetical protein
MHGMHTQFVELMAVAQIHDLLAVQFCVVTYLGLLGCQECEAGGVHRALHSTQS